MLVEYFLGESSVKSLLGRGACLLVGMAITMLLLMIIFLSSVVSDAPTPEIIQSGISIRHEMDGDRAMAGGSPRQLMESATQQETPDLRFRPEIVLQQNLTSLRVDYALSPIRNMGVQVPAPPVFVESSAGTSGASGDSGAGMGFGGGIGDGAGEGAYSTGELDAQPRLMHSPAPVYPQQAKRQRREGEVLVRLILDREGRVIDCRVLPGKDEDLFGQATLDAVRRWRFTPGTRGGANVFTRVDVPVVFALER